MTRKNEKIPQSLLVLLGEHRVGTVERNRDRLRFTYDEEWRESGPDIPLSIAMPLSGQVYEHDIISNWMWGLVTDNEQVLDRIAKQPQISKNNVLAILWAIGEDCAGDVQFVEPDFADDLVQGGDIKWLDDREIGSRLAQLRLDHSTGRSEKEGQFSLAGAQPKTALALVGGRLAVTMNFGPLVLMNFGPPPG